MLAIDPTGPEVERVERAIRYLARNRLEQPRLEEVADVMGLSPFHAQRVFSSIVGVSPKQFLGLLTVEHAKALLRDAESVLGAALEVGLSGPSRLHDLFVKIEAITPGEYRAEGRGLTMRWGIHATPFGEALFVVSERGLARLAFLADAGPDGALAEAQADWPLSTFVEDGRATAAYAKRAFRNLTGEALPAPFRVLVKGSPFQIQVWRALVRIPQGMAVSYGSFARALGHEGAARAVGSAVSRNRIGYLIPCHRVIRETGALGGYHWGVDLKRSLLAAEIATGVAAD